MSSTSMTMETYLSVEAFTSIRHKCKKNCQKYLVRYINHYDHHHNARDGIEFNQSTPSATFIITANGIQINIVYSQYNITSDHWLKLINAIENGDHHILYLSKDNDKMRIGTEFGSTTFTIESINGRDKAFSYIDVPNDQCLMAFREAYHELQIYEKYHKYYIAKI
ncbi:hypothetical protein [Acanthamoeba polyphaga mimivirus]|uniref:Uncharacterized protein n=4 Tax=Megamimivirinae TaxID=3044648 RepID=A0A2L2DIG4_MIMIV|nr:hypothetical protein MegaChil _gp0202 [Megavirus chiliensis]AVG45936.1 hypothetical protein [Acanthamoeba polyphaga mimivirus]AVG47039.1 hypothetical protein [Acanthamoeba polyphaga mimivirus]AVL93549.1 hypothetical protein mvi_189 [Megavirus vitis]